MRTDRQGLGAAKLFALVAVTSLSAVDPGAAAVAPCVNDCAELRVGSPAKDEGGVYRVAVSFQQGPDDEAPGGVDAISALAFSLAIPGLALADCSEVDGEGLTPAMVVPAAIAQSFWVVVENTVCAGPAPCLCPGPGEPRAEHVNIAVFGPRTIPIAALVQGRASMTALSFLRAGAQIDFPPLPDGEFLSLDLEPIEPPLAVDVRLHVFAETDLQETTPKPAFAAFASIGDDQAEDQTVDRETGVSRLRIVDGLIEATEPTFAGDCDGDRDVTIGELQLCVNVFLDDAPPEACLACDADGDGEIGIVDLQGAIGCFLGPGEPGCPSR